MDFIFNLEKFQKHQGRLCPCLLPSKTTAIQSNICPCKEFITQGKCRCMLFKEIKNEHEHNENPSKRSHS